MSIDLTLSKRARKRAKQEKRATKHAETPRGGRRDDDDADAASPMPQKHDKKQQRRGKNKEAKVQVGANPQDEMCVHGDKASMHDTAARSGSKQGQVGTKTRKRKNSANEAQVMELSKSLETSTSLSGAPETKRKADAEQMKQRKGRRQAKERLLGAKFRMLNEQVSRKVS